MTRRALQVRSSLPRAATTERRYGARRRGALRAAQCPTRPLEAGPGHDRAALHGFPVPPRWMAGQTGVPGALLGRFAVRDPATNGPTLEPSLAFAPCTRAGPGVFDDLVQTHPLLRAIRPTACTDFRHRTSRAFIAAFSQRLRKQGYWKRHPCRPPVSIVREKRPPWSGSSRGGDGPFVSPETEGVRGPTSGPSTTQGRLRALTRLIRHGARNVLPSLERRSSTRECAPYPATSRL